jgi:ribulose-bisphosphate carboxylase large chain
MPILPVVSSGQTGLQAPETYRRTKTIDLLYMAGGGIMAHPPARGGRRSASAGVGGSGGGVDLDQFAQTHPELRQQMEKFGNQEMTAHDLTRLTNEGTSGFDSCHS